MNKGFFRYAWKNTVRRLRMTGLLFFCAAMSFFSVTAAWNTCHAVRKGIALSRERFSADVVLLPYETEITDASMLFTGIAQSVYFDKTLLAQISNEYVERTSTQFYLQTIPYSGCCTTAEEMRLVGVDWKNDFTVTPYLNVPSFQGTGPKEVVVGSKVDLGSASPMILNVPVTVVGTLEETGTYLDESIIMSEEQLKKLARVNYPPSFFGDRDPDGLMTCVMVDLKEGTGTQEYLDSISSAEARKIDVSGLTEEVLKQENVLIALLAAAAVVIMITGVIAVSVQINSMVGHQLQEVGYLKALGIRKKDIGRIFYFEAAIVVVSAGAAGSLLGILVSGLAAVRIHEAMGVPVQQGSLTDMGVCFAAGIIISLLISRAAIDLAFVNVNRHSPQELMAAGDL